MDNSDIEKLLKMEKNVQQELSSKGKMSREDLWRCSRDIFDQRLADAFKKIGSMIVFISRGELKASENWK